MAEIGQEWTVAARDEALLSHCLGRDIPAVGLFYGGCEKHSAALVERQGILHRSIARVCTGRDSWAKRAS